MHALEYDRNDPSSKEVDSNLHVHQLPNHLGNHQFQQIEQYRGIILVIQASLQHCPSYQNFPHMPMYMPYIIITMMRSPIILTITVIVIPKASQLSLGLIG